MRRTRVTKVQGKLEKMRPTSNGESLGNLKWVSGFGEVLTVASWPRERPRTPKNHQASYSSRNSSNYWLSCVKLEDLIIRTPIRFHEPFQYLCWIAVLDGCQ